MSFCNPIIVLQAYLTELQDSDNNTSKITEDWIIHIIRDLFIAASDTTTVTLVWSMLYMIYFPEVQSKVQEEIDDVLTVNGVPRNVQVCKHLV